MTGRGAADAGHSADQRRSRSIRAPDGRAAAQDAGTKRGAAAVRSIRTDRPA
jgi:hypothetical protein